MSEEDFNIIGIVVGGLLIAAVSIWTLSKMLGGF